MEFIESCYKHGIKPIVAVTPDNQDPDIKYDNEDSGFGIR